MFEKIKSMFNGGGAGEAEMAARIEEIKVKLAEKQKELNDIMNRKLAIGDASPFDEGQYKIETGREEQAHDKADALKKELFELEK